MTEEISFTETSFLMIAFFDENGNELMELTSTCNVNDYDMRVPCIGEHIIFSSYEHGRLNDEKAIFRNFIKLLMLLHIIPRIRHTKIFMFNIR